MTLETKNLSIKDAKAAGSKEQKRYDMFVNAYSGMGGDYDPTRRFSFQSGDIQTQTDLEDLYRHNWISKRIVEAYAQDSIRQGIEINIKNDKNKKITTNTKGRLDELDAISKIEEFMILGRLYGGAIMIIGGLDGKKPDMPLDENNIKTIAFLNILDRYQLRIEQKYSDPLKNNYGQPEIYSLQPVCSCLSIENIGNKIHESRTIRFDGSYLPTNILELNEGWHDSELQPVFEAIRHLGISMQSASVLLQDFITKVLKLPNLTSLLATSDGRAALQTRINYAIANSSSIGITLLGPDEEYNKIQTPITGLVELLKLFMNQASSAAKIPEPVLFGQALGVLAGATESTRTWYDFVKSYQEKKVRPLIERLLKLMFLAKDSITKGNEPEEWSFKFNPLWQESETDIVNKRKAQAETDAIYIDRGVVMPEEISSSRFGADGYSIETVLDIKLREEMKAEEEKSEEAAELERLKAEEKERKKQEQLNQLQLGQGMPENGNELKQNPRKENPISSNQGEEV